MKAAVEARIRELKAEGMGILKIGRTVGVGTSVVQRVVAASATCCSRATIAKIARLKTAA